MSWLLAAISAAFLGGQKVKEMKRPTIPASYWRNKELMDEDKLNPNISHQQVMKNLENGKYYLSDAEYEKRNQPKDYSMREGEKMWQWQMRMAEENKKIYDELYGRK